MHTVETNNKCNHKNSTARLVYTFSRSVYDYFGRIFLLFILFLQIVRFSFFFLSISYPLRYYCGTRRTVKSRISRKSFSVAVVLRSAPRENDAPKGRAALTREPSKPTSTTKKKKKNRVFYFRKNRMKKKLRLCFNTAARALLRS